VGASVAPVGGDNGGCQLEQGQKSLDTSKLSSTSALGKPDADVICSSPAPGDSAKQPLPDTTFGAVKDSEFQAQLEKVRSKRRAANAACVTLLIEELRAWLDCDLLPQDWDTIQLLQRSPLFCKPEVISAQEKAAFLAQQEIQNVLEESLTYHEEKLSEYAAELRKKDKQIAKLEAELHELRQEVVGPRRELFPIPESDTEHKWFQKLAAEILVQLFDTAEVAFEKLQCDGSIMRSPYIRVGDRERLANRGKLMLTAVYHARRVFSAYLKASPDHALSSRVRHLLSQTPENEFTIPLLQDFCRSQSTRLVDEKAAFRAKWDCTTRWLWETQELLKAYGQVCNPVSCPAVSDPSAVSVA